jgi:hypothetical protein
MRGGQWQALHLMRGLQERGVEVRLLARRGTMLLAEAGLLGIEAAEISRLRLRAWSKWASLVHAHDAKAHTAAAVWSRAPVVVSRRVVFPIKSGLLSRWKYSRAALYLAVSHAVAHELEVAGVPGSRIRVVYDATPVPTRPGLRDGGVVALESSDPLKGGSVIRASGLDVEFTSKLLDALMHARVFLYVTESEGLGSAALAALAHGVPVVASRVGGLPEVVRHEETGLLVDSNDAESVRAAVLRLLSDEDLAVRLGKDGRRMVESEFSVARMVERTMAAYCEVIGN